MTDLNQAVSDLSWLAQRLSGIISLKDELVSFQTLQNQAKELQSSITRAKSDLADIQEQKDTAVQSIQAAHAEASDILSKANAEAAQLVAQAKQDAVNVRGDAAAKAKVMQDKAAKALSDLQDQITKAAADLADKQKLQAQIEQSISSLTAELSALKARLG